MLEPVIIELPGPPVGKGRPRFGAGRTYTPEKTRAYETALKLKAMEAMRGRFAFSGAVRIAVIAAMPVPRSWSADKQRRAVGGLIHPITKPDCDNFLKTIDALNGVVWADDSQVIEATVIKRYAAQPSLRIEVGLL